MPGSAREINSPASSLLERSGRRPWAIRVMRLHWGPGPVFAFESLLAARRWQVYALRSFYVGALLLGLTLTWGPSEARSTASPTRP